MPDPSPSPSLGGSTTELKRTIGPITLIFFGVGSMLGAGIYALVGTAAGQLGNAVWLGFAVAMVAALLTGLSYASIGSRYPRAGGAAYATQRAFGINMLSYVVGLSVVASGLTSMAAGSRAIGAELVKMGSPLQPGLMAIIYLCLLSLIVFRGIRESMWMNIVCTTIEFLGLMFVIVVGFKFWGSVNLLQGPPLASGDGFEALTVSIVMSGAVLTFFSFIGFEDILNVSEETKNPETTIPIGLIGAMLIASVVYMAVAITAVSVGLPNDQLVNQGLRGVVAKAAPWFSPNLFSVITIFAVANTALLNYVMGSRLVYGMARQSLLPKVLGKVHAKRQTPHVAVFVLLVLVIALMLTGKLAELGAVTVLLLLSVFTVVNIALLVVKHRPGEPRGRFEVPSFVPILGALTCTSLLFFRVVYPPASAPNAAYIALAILVIASILYLVIRPRSVEVA